MRRLTPALLTLLMFGVVGLLVVAYIGKSMFAREDRRAPIATRNIPMAIADIEPGTVITESHVGMGPFPTDKLQHDMLLANRVVVGRVAKAHIKAAQPIRANTLYQPGELPPLKVAADKRAVSLEIGDGTSMVDGMIKPGNYVDVLFTVANDQNNQLQGGLTMRLFEGVKVIAINSNYSQARVERDRNRVTLELSEPQANVLTLAKDRGRINLTYNPNGAGTGGVSLNNRDRVTLDEILGLRAPAPAKQPFLAEIFKRNARSVNRFDDRGVLIEQNGPQAPAPAGRQPLAPAQPGPAFEPVPTTTSGGSPTAQQPRSLTVPLPPTAVRPGNVNH